MSAQNIQLGLRENWQQFTILVIVNAFVGGMIGLERSIFPKFAEAEFGISSHTAILSFIIAFGISKAVTNYFTGKLANRFGRKNLLLAGWLLSLPVPFILIYANAWSWVILANVLLGIHQGLTWSSTVVMKIDLVGEKDRGFAMGLNEFAGYLAVGIVAYLTGFVADSYGVTPYPFYLGIGISVVGLFLTLFFVKDTHVFAKKEGTTSTATRMGNIFWDTTLRDKTLSSITQAGMVNNLNDGMIWGLLPIVLLSLSFGSKDIGIITAIYPMVWGIGQLVTGKLADVYSKKGLLFWGMLAQGFAILLIPFSSVFWMLAAISVVLGLGTAMVYPTFLAAIAQATHPNQRAESIGVFRLWRDLGYAFGAVISGLTADLFGLEYAIFFIGGLTIASSLLLKFRMPETAATTKECMEVEEVKTAILKHEKIQIVDVRSKEEYDQNHIPEAINITLADLRERVGKLDKQAQIITVCGKGGGRSSAGAKLLKEFGFNAIWLCGGTNKWLGLGS